MFYRPNALDITQSGSGRKLVPCPFLSGFMAPLRGLTFDPSEFFFSSRRENPNQIEHFLFPLIRLPRMSRGSLISSDSDELRIVRKMGIAAHFGKHVSNMRFSRVPKIFSERALAGESLGANRETGHGFEFA